MRATAGGRILPSVDALLITVLVVAAVLLVVVLAVVVPRTIRQRRRAAFVAAAAAADLPQLAALLDKGVSVHTRDPRGDSAMHQAYYRGNKKVVAFLSKHGADESAMNFCTVKAYDMRLVALTEDLFDRAARRVTPDGEPIGDNAVREIYRTLSRTDFCLYGDALGRVVSRSHPDHRQRVLRVAIRVGLPGSEHSLAHALWQYGHKNMAEDYVNCDSEVLRSAAEQWARLNHFRLLPSRGGAFPSWGRLF